MVTVEEAAKEFLLACRANGLKPATMRWYRHMLKPLVGRFWHQPIDQVSVNELRQYVIDLRARGQRYVNAPQRPTVEGGLSHDSLSDHLRAMKRFFNWYVEEYDLVPQRNPMRKIKLPKKERREPKAINLDNLKILLDACEETPAGIRDKAMLAFWPTPAVGRVGC